MIQGDDNIQDILSLSGGSQDVLEDDPIEEFSSMSDGLQDVLEDDPIEEFSSMSDRLQENVLEDDPIEDPSSMSDGSQDVFEHDPIEDPSSSVSDVSLSEFSPPPDVPVLIPGVAPTPIPDTPAPIVDGSTGPFSFGERIESCWNNNPLCQCGEWRSSWITNCNSNDTYNIMYEDGKSCQHVTVEFIKPFGGFQVNDEVRKWTK